MWNVVEKKFPDYFCNFELPTDLDEDEFVVYRACITGVADEQSFLNSYEEAGRRVPESERHNPSAYSLSVYKKPKEIARFVSNDRRMKYPWNIATGKTNPIHGVHKETKYRLGRDGRKRKTSHVDWWLYEDSQPWIDFTVIDNFDDYLDNYKA